jgi:hypothetical protein
LLHGAGASAEIELRRISDDETAQRECFLGSPTVRVDGHDVEPGARDRRDFGLKCRLYATGDGLRGTPLDDWVLDALVHAEPAWRDSTDFAPRVSTAPGQRRRLRPHR